MDWYRRLGYKQEWEHRFEPGFPAFVSVARDGGSRLFLSEHKGDARPDTLVYLRVTDLDAIASEFGVGIEQQPWAREVYLQRSRRQPATDRDAQRVAGTARRRTRQRCDDGGVAMW